MGTYKQAMDYMLSQDKHLVTLFSWINTLSNFKQQVRETEMDKEFEDELEKILLRLRNEVAERVILIFGSYDIQNYMKQ